MGEFADSRGISPVGNLAFFMGYKGAKEITVFGSLARIRREHS